MASDIKLVFYSSAITMMHGPINIRGRIRLPGHVPRMGRREMRGGGGMRKPEREIPLGKRRRRLKIEFSEIG